LHIDMCLVVFGFSCKTTKTDNEGKTIEWAKIICIDMTYSA
jgi:hypothetical protein